VSILAFKWIRIVFRCWKDGKPYDEQVYQKSLRRRSSLLGAALGTRLRIVQTFSTTQPDTAYNQKRLQRLWP
jgi:hypothetical protein